MKEWKSEFDKRQLKEIEFCKVYKKDFNHGTQGHNTRVIVADLAEIVENMEREMLRMERELEG